MKTCAFLNTTTRMALVPALAALSTWGVNLAAAEEDATPLTAEQRLEQVAQELREASADREALAGYHHDRGLQALKAGDIQLALQELTLAVDYSSGRNETYQKDLERAAAMAGLSGDPRSIHVDDIASQKMVLEQQLWVEIQQRIENGISHLAAERYNQAHQSLSMALVRLESLSYADERRAAEIARVNQLIKDSEERRQVAERARAADDLALANQRQQELRQYELRLERQRIDAMLSRATMARERREYDECILYCEQVLKLNPAEARANDLLVRARRERHVHVRQMTAVEWDEQHKRLSEEIRKQMLPQFEVVAYADDWAEIEQRRSSSLGFGETEDEQWRTELRAQLQQQLTLEFEDAEIMDVVQFLQQNTGVNIVLDPEVVASGEVPPITMHVQDIRMENALEYIMTLSGLKFVMRDESLFISTAEGVQGDTLMRIYDIADLTHPLTDFPGPHMRIPEPGAESSLLVQEIQIEDDSSSIDYFIEIVQSVVAPETWDEMEGVSIGEHNGQMVITHTGDVHKSVENLLHTLRNQRGIQINVKTKWLNVEDGTLEKIGVNLLGYAPIYDDNGNQLNPDPVPARAADANGVGNTGVFKSDDDDFDLGTINNRDLQDGWYDTSFFSSGATLQGGLNTQYMFYEDPQGLLGSVIVDAIEQSRRGNVVTQPNLTLFNGQRAHLVNLVQEAYVADYDVSGSQYDPVISVISYGTVLDVRAIASADRKYITLSVKPTVSRLDSFFDVAISSTQFAFPLNYPIRVPLLEYQSVETTVTIPDGGSILLAGLTSASSGRAHSGVPFLSHIPFLGRLFSTNARSETEEKTIISVSADIILFDELEARL